VAVGVSALPSSAVASDGGGTAGEPPEPNGFDIAEINRSYALAIWGGKAVVVNEQPHGPVNDRVRVMSFDSMNSWFANRYTEMRGADGRKRSVTWARAWHQHRDRRQYAGVEFFPNPDGAAPTPKYLNLWRGFTVSASDVGSCEKFKDHLRVNVCQEDERLFRYLFGWMAHLVQRPRDRAGIALVLRGRKGTGKTKVGEVLGALFAPHYFLVDEPPHRFRGIVREGVAAATRRLLFGLAPVVAAKAFEPLSLNLLLQITDQRPEGRSLLCG
jgi:hypothetical protein